MTEQIPLDFLSQWTRERSRAAACYVEVYAVRSQITEITFRKGRLEEDFSAAEMEISLRLLDGRGREGLASSSLPVFSQLSGLFEKASAMMACMPEDPFRAPPLELDFRDRPQGRAVAVFPDLGLWEPSLQSPAALKEASALIADLDGALSHRRHCAPLRASFSIVFEEKYLITSAGLSLSERSSCVDLEWEMLASRGMQAQTASCSMTARNLAALRRDMVPWAADTAERAVRMLSAKALSCGRRAVVVDADCAVAFMELYSGTFCADAVQKGMSPWKDCLGREVASKQVSFLDNARLYAGAASSAWDGEGLPTGERRVVDRGILTSFLYDSYTSRLDGTRSTANAHRSLAGSVFPAPWNFYLEAGRVSRQELLRDTWHGLMLTEILGLHTVDPATGDFSLAGSGFLIEKGEPTSAVSRFTVSGNLYEMLSSIDAVASDLKFYDAIAAPSFRVPVLDIGGQ